MTSYNPTFIKDKKGRAVAAVLTMEEWEDIQDMLEIEAGRARIAAGEEGFPAEVARRLLDENPVRVFRTYRNLTQADLAQAAGITQGYVADIETGKRQGSTKVMKAIAEALKVDIDLII